MRLVTLIVDAFGQNRRMRDIRTGFAERVQIDERLEHAYVAAENNVIGIGMFLSVPRESASATAIWLTCDVLARHLEDNSWVIRDVDTH